MKGGKRSQRLTKSAYRLVRVLVRILSALILLLVGTFIFFRLYGVPAPLLREMVRQANHAGIPVDVERVNLTLRGWHAYNVHYYSKHPDDLKPIFQAREVFFSRKIVRDTKAVSGWHFDIEALGITLQPSVEWGIEVPAESASRSIDHARLSLGFYADRIELTDGTLSWLGGNFQVSGTFLKSESKQEGAVLPAKKTEKRAGAQKTVLPVYVTAEQFQRIGDRLKSIQMTSGMDVTVKFLVNARDYSASRFDFGLKAPAVVVKGVDFSGAELTGVYAYPKLELTQAALYHNTQSIRLEGDYDLESGMVQGEVNNEITTRKLLLLLPQPALDVLRKVTLSFDELPQLSLRFGPARPAGLLNALAGSFSCRGISYCGLDVESLRGTISRKDNRLELSKLEGVVAGQQSRAGEVGSGLVGGTAAGSVFWDATSHEFGVSASGRMDPNLLLKPLSIVRIATNVINRFKFPEQPPEISLELGADYTNWKSFYINIQGTGRQVKIHDALFSSVNTTGFYKHGVLRLDPIAATVGADYIKGNASLDFLNSTAHFDASGTVHPEVLEDAICPRFNLFGNGIKTSGSTQVKARGSLDWKTMEKTDFSAEVEAEQVEIPVARVAAFSANVTGDGPTISVKDAAFNVYGGKGAGDFSIQLNPATNRMPYEMSVKVVGADFKKCLQFLNPHIGNGIEGLLTTTFGINADMALDFFKTANGKGRVVVDQGQLADLPLFRGFSKLMRKVVPGFNVFSITSLRGNFELKKGVVHTDDAYLEGDVISAKGHGSYSRYRGFDALVQAQVMSENPVSKVIRAITDPILKLFEMKLEGSLSDPSWSLERFHSKSRDTGSVQEGSDSN